MMFVLLTLSRIKGRTSLFGQNFCFFKYATNINLKYSFSCSSLNSTLHKSLIKENYVQNYLDSVAKSVELNTSNFTNNILNSYLLNIFKTREELINNLKSLTDLTSEESNSKEWETLIKAERSAYEENLINVEYELINALAPQIEDADAVVLEITAGVGGKESMLFAKDLFDMYNNYFIYKSWSSFVANVDTSELGGLRKACILVEGSSVLKHLQHEAGVHRVQRVPATEKSGRIHTSTISVSVIPQPPELEVNLADKDLIIETKRSSGAGGQHVNTTDSAVRITHIPTGMIVEVQTDRSQIKNKRMALRQLCAKIYQKQQEEQTNNIRMTKKIQVGTKARSEKVRTYNYPQDRITDHRIGHNFHNLPMFLEGGEMFDEAVQKLIEFTESENYIAFLNSLKQSH